MILKAIPLIGCLKYTKPYNFTGLCVKGFSNYTRVLRGVETIGPSYLLSLLKSEFHNYLISWPVKKNIFSRRSFTAVKMSEDDQYSLPNDYPIVELECQVAFDALSNKQKLYAHYLSLASWHGSLAVYLQTSPESPLIFSLLTKVFSNEPIDELKKAALIKGFSEDNFTAFLVYSSVFFSNSGNYKGFGDTKFVPNLPVDQLEVLLKTSKAWNSEPEALQSLWDRVKGPLYSLSEREKQLSYPDKGITCYLSKNCTKEDTVLVNDFLKSKGLEAYNTRLFKIVKNNVTKFEIRLAAIETSPDVIPEADFKGSKFVVTKGDYSPIMKLLVQHLGKAKEHAANDFEKKMLDHYQKSFTTGSLDAHKDGSRQWIKNKDPIIETYIGFIETYRDPAGSRGEFEGFVAMVNKPMSEKFNTLVNKAESLLTRLPWTKEFEKDTFLQPDFTSLDVLSFSGSGIPAGINIPNYDEIRQNEGFKNVSLGNVIPAAYKDAKTPFLTQEDSNILEKLRIPAFEVQVGLHELLGHGSGKMFCQTNDGFNFDADEIKHPFTGKKISTFYKVGETYDSLFTSLGSTYEECRAECAHSQARYVILRVLLEAGGGLLEVKETDPGKDLLITLDRTKIPTVGKKAIGDFLHKLQASLVYKATADLESAKNMYNKYAEVPEDGPYPFAKWRAIALAQKKPRKILVQANTKEDGGKIYLKRYPPTPEGVVQSYIDRFTNMPTHPSILLEELWKMDKDHF
uniref:Dipeptidyl peptidase 3 n=1 Tax=Timema douglasi TaxID=61478 RepID=A0A7R8VHF0_TIMDO|nr:unnamed protein product [Timema douglasi]